MSRHVSDDPNQSPRPRSRGAIKTGDRAPTVMRPVKSVGRHAGRDYCGRCGHTRARCICVEGNAR